MDKVLLLRAQKEVRKCYWKLQEKGILVAERQNLAGIVPFGGGQAKLAEDELGD